MNSRASELAPRSNLPREAGKIASPAVVVTTSTGTMTAAVASAPDRPLSSEPPVSHRVEPGGAETLPLLGDRCSHRLAQLEPELVLTSPRIGSRRPVRRGSSRRSPRARRPSGLGLSTLDRGHEVVLSSDLLHLHVGIASSVCQEVLAERPDALADDDPEAGVGPAIRSSRRARGSAASGTRRRRRVERSRRSRRR